MKILGIAGSLRRASYNRAVIEAARELAPASIRIEPFDLNDIPLYNADFDVEGLWPAEVERLKQSVTNADGLLIATRRFIAAFLEDLESWVHRMSPVTSLQ
jgi:chromate reductase